MGKRIMVTGGKKFAAYIVLAAIIGAGVWYFQNHRWPANWRISQTDIFMGEIVGFDRDYILMRGLPDVDGAAAQYPQGLGVVVTITPDTRIIKNSGLFQLHAVPGETPSVEDIQRDSQPVSLAELKKDVFSHELMIKVTATENIVGKQYFTAAEINYALDNRLNPIR